MTMGKFEATEQALKQLAPTSLKDKMTATLGIEVSENERVVRCAGMYLVGLNGKSAPIGCNDYFTIKAGEEYGQLRTSHGQRWSLHAACLRKYLETHTAYLKYDYDQCIWVEVPEPEAVPVDVPRLHRIESLTPTEIRTQKAVGVRELVNGCLSYATEVPTTILLQSAAQVEIVPEALLVEHDIKARPCPKRPRHGGVPSRVVKSLDALREVWQRAQADDPESEVILQPNVEAKFNAILTPTAYSVGRGCDGATAGINTERINLGEGDFYSTNIAELARAARIEPDEDYYLEMVTNDVGYTHLVQLRGGPRIPATRDYVPREMRVAEVYRLFAESDTVSEEKLLMWEKTLPTLPPGTVVYHKGGSVTSHYGVQCLAHGIPYITTFEPQVGQVLEPRGDFERHDGDATRDGMHAGLLTADEHVNYELNTLAPIFCVHNALVERSPLGSWWLGYSAARLWRMMAMACLGEMRHFRGSHQVIVPWEDQKQQALRNSTIITPPWMLDPWEPEPWLLPYLNDDQHRRRRDEIFKEYWPERYATLAQKLAVATRSFLTHHWSAGMGGLNWGRSGLVALELYEAMVHVSRRPTSRAIGALISRANRAVNMVHNGGKLLNKFVDESCIDRASRLDRSIFLSIVMPVFNEVLEQVKQPTAPAMVEQPRTWRRELPRELIRYAKDEEDSIKRCDHPSGSKRIMEEQQVQIGAASRLGLALNYMWHDYTRECYNRVLGMLWRFHTDAVLYEIEEQERQAEVLKAQLTKIRAEVRRRRKKGGYAVEKPKKAKPLQVAKVCATTEQWQLDIPVETGF